MSATRVLVLAAALVVVPGWAFGQPAGAAPAPEAQSRTSRGVAAGQDSSTVPRVQDPQPVLPRPADPADPAELGLSLTRIRRELRELPPTQSALLRYDFHVNVYGTKSKIDFFKDFDLSPNGPVRYGGMTHAEFMSVVTPQAFKAPAGDLLSVAILAFQELIKKKSGGDQGPNR